MTEELKQKFNKLYKKRRNFYESHRKMAENIGFEGWQKNEMFQYYKKGATEATKELQEQNELLAKHILELQKDKGVLTDKVADLEKQIEKMKQDAEQEKCELLGIIQGKDKVIKELQHQEQWTILIDLM